MRTRIATSCALMMLAGCLTVPALSVPPGATDPLITVVPSGSRVTAPAKAAGCDLIVLRTAPRDRDYDELASLHYTTALHWSGDPAAAQNAIRDHACALGADAVVVTQEFVPGGGEKAPAMAGLAIRFRSTAPSVPAASAAAP